MAHDARDKIVLTPTAYRNLLGDLRHLLEAGRARIEAAIGAELVRTYHALGRRIIAAGLPTRAAQGGGMVPQLADELGIHPRLLSRAIAFARLYPDLPPQAQRLRWIHYRELIAIKDPRARSWYEERAAERGWSGAKLLEAIRDDGYAKGAHSRKKAPGRKRPAALSRPREASYVYKAFVERVVDGDTLLLVIDLGFQVRKEQRVRLALIDTPPLSEPGGKKARTFVDEALARVDFVMIKTVKIDLYGRYVAHVFYGPGEDDKERIFAEGRYLNEELVARGLATAM